ncbi:MAG: hypothetical protein DRO67_03250 [Candidatus Asgardarchaeum californiense]|nr:MAG: hypothetical protein DRO67_03250 [Candidatus Asgardarchaeum californiense]
MKVPKNKLKIGDYIVKYPFTILKVCYITKLTNDSIIVMGKIIKRQFMSLTCRNCFNRFQCRLYHEALPYLEKPVNDAKLVCEIIINFAEAVPKLKGLLYDSTKK